LFVLCGRLSWLHVSFLLHVKYTVSYRIVSHGTKYCRKVQISMLGATTLPTDDRQTDDSMTDGRLIP